MSIQEIIVNCVKFLSCLHQTVGSYNIKNYLSIIQPSESISSSDNAGLSDSRLTSSFSSSLSDELSAKCGKRFILTVELVPELSVELIPQSAIFTFWFKTFCFHKCRV